MKLSQSTKNILTKYSVKVDLEKEYSAFDIILLQDKIISFLDRKIVRIKATDIDTESNSDNLEELEHNVEKDFEILGIDGLLEKYSIQYLLTLHTDSCYTVASTMRKVLKNHALPIDQMWNDIIANYGNIPNTYRTQGENL